MVLQEAIEEYHELLTDELAQETSHQLSEQLRRRGLFFGERPLCSVLRPRFLTPEQYRFLQDRTRLLLGAFAKIYGAALESRELRDRFGLLDWEESLLEADPGFPEPSPVSRLDAFFVHERGGLRFTEYNAETPAAAAYNDVLAEVFFGLPVMRRYLRRFEVRPQPARHNVLHALLEAFQEWSGARAKPERIAIVDWRDVPTFSEFVISAEYFRSQGLECVIVDPRELEYGRGTLFSPEGPVDLVYKRVLISELVERGGLEHPLVRAVTDGSVCMVNSFRCKILHKKASLAVLSDERTRPLFDEEESRAIERHVPWTRVVEQRKTRFGEREIDLVPFALEHREDLVLKANDEYGGKGIVLGWETDATGWEEAVSKALDEPTVVQERVQLPTEEYPHLEEGRVRFGPRIVDTAPFCFHGAYMDGCLTRLSTESLVNVTAGGGSSLATFVVARR